MDVHNEFRELVDRHITSKLTDFGISEDAFYEACASSRFSSQVSKSVYDQMLALDDFLTFKKLMVKRNMQLELEAVKALQASQEPVKAPVSAADAEVQLQMALKASADLSPSERATMRMAEQESKEGEAGPPNPEAEEMEKQLRAAMQANMTEMELFHKQEEYEQLQLEQAIAASLALHEGELREAKLEAKRLESMDDSDLGLLDGESEESYAADEKKPAAVVGSMSGGDNDDNDSFNEDDDDGDDEGGDEEKDEVMYGTPMKPSAVDHSLVERVAEAKVTETDVEHNVVDAKVAVIPEKEQGSKEEMRMASAAVSVLEEAEPVIEATVLGAGEEVVVKKKKKKDKDKKKKKKKKLEAKSGDGGDGLPGIGGASLPPLGNLKGPLGGARPLGEIKPLSELQDEMAERKKQAEEAFRKNHEMLLEQREQQEELRRQAKFTDEEMKKRAEHLKRQRDLIIAKKKAEREKAVKSTMVEENERTEEIKMRLEEERERRDESVAAGEGAVEQQSEEAKGELSESDIRRQNMRIALAARMKRDMLLAEEERLSKMQSDQFAELDEKLRKVEELREENRLRENELKDAIKHNQELRAINMHRSGVDMGAGINQDDLGI